MAIYTRRSQIAERDSDQHTRVGLHSLDWTSSSYCVLCVSASFIVAFDTMMKVNSFWFDFLLSSIIEFSDQISLFLDKDRNVCRGQPTTRRLDAWVEWRKFSLKNKNKKLVTKWKVKWKTLRKSKDGENSTKFNFLRVKKVRKRKEVIFIFWSCSLTSTAAVQQLGRNCCKQHQEKLNVDDADFISSDF